MKKYRTRVNPQFQLKSITEAGILKKTTLNYKGTLYEK